MSEIARLQAAASRLQQIFKDDYIHIMAGTTGVTNLTVYASVGGFTEYFESIFHLESWVASLSTGRREILFRKFK